MNKISNDFITIEYDSETGRKTAEYYMELFNKEPEYFKGILNGRNTIHASHIPLPITNDEISRGNIIKYILEEENAKCTLFCGYKPSMQGIYYSIMTYSYDEITPEDIKYTYHDLAYDYLQMTGDFSYLKKYYYEGKTDTSDITALISNKLKNNYDELLIEKIKDAKESRLYPIITNNIDKIEKIVNYAYNQSNSLDYKQIPIPEIDEKKLDELVIGTLNYIDPTNKLVEEYLELKNNNAIEKIYNEKDNSSKYTEHRDQFYNFVFGNIDLYMNGNLLDVVDLVHELGHHFARKEDPRVKRKSILFNEFPSIYFELKAIEYLSKVYSKEDIEAIKRIRIKNNRKNSINLKPSLYALRCNINNDGEYHIEEVRKYVEDYWKINYKKQIETTSPRRRKPIFEAALFRNSIKSLNRIDQDESRLEYLIGTYYATYAIENLATEDVLNIIENTRYNTIDFIDLEKLLGMNKSEIAPLENSIQKVKQKQV